MARKKKGAIQEVVEDVPNEVEETDSSNQTDESNAVKPKLDTRNYDFIEEIANRLEGTSEETEEEEQDEQEEQEEEILEETSDDEETLPEDEDIQQEEEIEIVVDGKKQTVPLSKILDAGKRTIQKESAADSRLEEATRLLKEAKKEKGNPVAQPSQQRDVANDEALESLRLKYIKASQYGSEEEAIDALKAYEKAIRAPQPTITRDDIAKEMTAIEIRRHIDAKPDNGGYSDLTADPILQNQFAIMVDNIVSTQNGRYDDLETYKKAGDALRLIGKTLSPNYTPPEIKDDSNDSFKGKKARKKNITSIKKASAKSELPGVDNETELTNSQIIAEIKKARGQLT